MSKPKYSAFFIFLGVIGDFVIHLTTDMRFEMDITAISLSEYIDVICEHPLAFLVRVLVLSVIIYYVSFIKNND